MRTLAELRRHEELTLRDAADAAGRFTAAEEPPGVNPRIRAVKVVGFGAGNKTFSCQEVDASCNVIGTAFTVYAWSLPSNSPAVSGFGNQDLTQCAPLYQVGDYIRIAVQDLCLASGRVCGWAALDTFIRRC